MRAFNDVVVAIDFSPTSLAALRRAQALAGPQGTVRLLHVIGAYPAIYTDRHEFERMYEELTARARGKLEELARPIREAGGVARIEVEVAIGRPADEILAFAARSNAELLTVGTHARGTTGRMLLGSVSEEIARRSSIPVLVVREMAEGGRTERVLLAVDHDSPSREAARVGADLAKKIGARLEGIHVIEIPIPAPYLGGPLAFPFGDLTPELVEDVRCRISEEVERAVGQKVDVRFVAGPPAREIIRFAHPSDIIVCGTHGRGALGRLAFGSVATKLLRRAPCPVLVVRPIETPAAVATGATSAASAR